MLLRSFKQKVHPFMALQKQATVLSPEVDLAKAKADLAAAEALRRRGSREAADGFAKLDALATVQVRPAWSPEWLYRPDQLRSE